MKLKEFGDRFSGTIVGPAICFVAGLFVHFPRPDWQMIGFVTLAGLGIGLLVDFSRFLMSREGNAFGNALAVTMVLPPLYVAFEMAMRRQWSHGPGQSLVTIVLVALAAGLMIDFVRFMRRRHLRRQPVRNHRSSDILNP